MYIRGCGNVPGELQGIQVSIKCNWNGLGKPTVEGESPVQVKYNTAVYIPSSTEHEKFCVNQRGPYYVRLNTLIDR